MHVLLCYYVTMCLIYYAYVIYILCLYNLNLKIDTELYPKLLFYSYRLF